MRERSGVERLSPALECGRDQREALPGSACEGTGFARGCGLPSRLTNPLRLFPQLVQFTNPGDGVIWQPQSRQNQVPSGSHVKGRAGRGSFAEAV